MAIGREKGCGRLSVTKPTTGCSIDAVSWNASVIMPIWAKSSLYESFKIGYNAGTSD